MEGCGGAASRCRDYFGKALSYLGGYMFNVEDFEKGVANNLRVFIEKGMVHFGFEEGVVVDLVDIAEVVDHEVILGGEAPVTGMEVAVKDLVFQDLMKDPLFE